MKIRNKLINKISRILLTRNTFIASGEKGFSLIEVNMAILVIGMGILVLFSLFPAGLREGEHGLADTHCALFGETVLEGLRGRAHTKDPAKQFTWAQWSNINTFINNFTITVNRTLIHGYKPHNSRISNALEFPAGAVPKKYIRYILEISEGDTPMTRIVNLWVWSGQYSTTDKTKFKEQAKWFSTKYVYGEGL